MGYLDSDSENDSSLSSNGEWDCGDIVATSGITKKSASKKKEPLSPSVLEGDVDQRLKTVMSLKKEMGVEKDPGYIAKENHKQSIIKEIKAEQETLRSLNTGERILYQTKTAGDLMVRIKQKREQSKKDLMANSSHSNQSLGGFGSCNSLCSVATSITVDTEKEDEMTEFRRLKLRKEQRRRMKSHSPMRSTPRVSRSDRKKTIKVTTPLAATPTAD